MHLALTADQSFWDKSKKILFLGSWCRIYNDRKSLEGLEIEELPFIWNDRELLFADYKQLRIVYERILPIVAEQLNLIHATNHHPKFWRIIIGYWLSFFIEVVYNRYSALLLAKNSLKVDSVNVVSEKNRLVPSEFFNFQRRLVFDQYNQQLIGDIIKELELFNYQVVDLPAEHIIPQRKTSELKKLIKKALQICATITPDCLNRYVFIDSYIDIKELAKLQLALSQIPYLRAPQIEVPICVANLELRKALLVDTTNNSQSDPFEKLVEKLWPLHIPTAYLESFKYLEKQAINSFPKKPKAIISATAHFVDEPFKIWAAHKVQNGSKLICLQHGGHYGVGLFNSCEEEQIKVADKFVTWGWKRPQVIDLEANKLIGIKKKMKVSNSGQILWGLFTNSRYANWLYSIPQGPQVGEYIEQQHQFYLALPIEVRKKLLLRLYPQDLCWNELERWQDWTKETQDLKIYQGPISMNQQLCESSLFISTYNSTTYLETFAANYPTLMFWNPKHWEVHEEAQKDFEPLIELGILHFTPQAAAQKLSEIYLDPISWWQDPKIQEAVKTYSYKYARTSDNWIKNWKEALHRICE